MIKTKALTLLSNVKTDREVRDNAIQLVRELGGVVSSVTSLNENRKLQNVIAKTTLGYSTYVALRSLIKLVRDNSQPKVFVPKDQEFFVRIFNTDVLFTEIENYIKKNTTHTHKPMDEMVMKTFNRGDYDDDELSNHHRQIVENSKGKQGVHLYRETFVESEVNLEFGGHHVEVELVEPQPKPMPQASPSLDLDEPIRRRRSSNMSLERMLEGRHSYLFKCKSKEAQDAVLEFLLELGPKAHNVGEQHYRGSIDLMIAQEDGNGEWSSVPARTPDTVILPDGLMEEIVSEIKTFLNYEDIYNLLGVPYHHGIMLSGAPGTGKSSAAQAIASALHMTTYSISISSMENNKAFRKFISRVGSNSIVLIEDIDAAVAAKDGENTKGVTRDVLLNTLDGLESPHGCVFIVTTNHPDKIDEAVKRPGRIDAVYDITYLVDEQFERLCKKFMGLDPYEKLDLPSVEGLKITPAEIISEIKPHIPNLRDALPSVIEYVNDKRALFEASKAEELVAA